MYRGVLVYFLFLWIPTEQCVPGSMFLVPTPLSRTEGRAECVHHGADIAVVDTAEKVRAALSVMDSVPDVSNAWIGLMMTDFNVFTWESGGATLWENFESSMENEQSCVRLTRNGRWRKTDCSHKYPTVCMTDGSMGHTHLILDSRGKATLSPPLEKTWTLSLLGCVTRCSKRCPGCTFLLFSEGECSLYDDTVASKDFNVTSSGTTLYISYMSGDEAVNSLARTTV